MAFSLSNSPQSPTRLTPHGWASRVSPWFFRRSENAQRVSPILQAVITSGATRSEHSRISNGGSVPSSPDGSDGRSSPFSTSPTGLSETRTVGKQDAVAPRSGTDPIDLEMGITDGKPATVEQSLVLTHSIASASATCLGISLGAMLMAANIGGLPKVWFLAGALGTVFSLGPAVSALTYGWCYREGPAASTWMKRIAYSSLCISMLCSTGLAWALVVKRN